MPPCSVAADGHVPTGFGIQDFTQPLFVFVTGVSASLAFRKFVRPDGGIDLAALLIWLVWAWKRLRDGRLWYNVQSATCNRRQS